MKHCCSQMERDLERHCDDHPDRFECPDCLIKHIPKYDEYGIIVHDGGSSHVTISYCPWCGKKLPSKRDLWFEAIEKLGLEPDSDEIPKKFMTDAWYKQDPAAQLVDGFLKDGWKSNPFDRVVSLLQEDRDLALPLALLVLDRVSKRAAFFDLLLSHLTEEEFVSVVASAVAKLRGGPAAVADSVVAYASVQFPHLLTPYLRELFTLEPNSGAYYEGWPWRGADASEISALKELVHNGTSEDVRNRAWKWLVETRLEESIEFAAQEFPPALAELDPEAGIDAYALWAGFDVSSHPPRRLYADRSHHIVFPVDYFKSRPSSCACSNHPTWSLDDPEAFPGKIGGQAAAKCERCGGALHILLQIENAQSLLATSLPRVELCTCLSCLGWEEDELFFVHDRAGKPSSLDHDEDDEEPEFPVEPEFPAEPLKPTAVRYVPSPPRWTFQDWGLSNGRENLNRIGGAPSWIQSPRYPECPQCENLMSFVAQLDSGLRSADGGEWQWGSGGICYLFWCEACRISASLWQCT